MDKTEGTELSQVEKNNSDVNVKSSVKEERRITFRERMRRLVNFFTVEPFLMSYLFSAGVAQIAVSQINLEKACLTVLYYNETECGALINRSNDNFASEVENATSGVITSMTAWQQPLQSGISAIFILFIGAWSDRTGNRKALMLIPLVGEIISTSGMLLATYYFLEWPLWVTACIEVVPTALSGGLSLAIMGSYSYIADVTTVESRTFRLGVVATIAILGYPVGTSVSGILMESVGYYGVFSITLTFYIFGFLYTYFKIHNIRNDTTEGTLMYKLCSFFNPVNVWDSISLLIVTPLKQKIRIILLLCAYILIVGPAMGIGPIYYYYLLNRYGMDNVEISLFNTYSSLMSGAGAAIAVTLFSKYLKMDDAILGVIGTACRTVASFVFGLAPTKQWCFAAPAFDIFGSSGTTAIRSIGTKVVDPDEVGKMNSLFCLVDALSSFIYAPILSKVYHYTFYQTPVPGAVYFLGSVLTIPAFFVFMTLYILLKRDQKDAVKDPNAKEMHAYDNQVTPL